MQTDPTKNGRQTDPTKNGRRARRSCFLLDTRLVNHIVRSHENLVGNRKKRKQRFLCIMMCFSFRLSVVPRLFDMQHIYSATLEVFACQYRVKQEAWRVLDMRVFVEFPYIDLNCSFIVLYHQRTYMICHMQFKDTRWTQYTEVIFLGQNKFRAVLCPLI